jgi:hypothetical protein
LSKSSALLSEDNPRVVTAGYQIGPPPVAPATLGHVVAIRPGQVGERLAGIVRRLGDLIFMANDEEAYWRGWTIERRYAGLGRRYRDPVFDTVASCPHCQGLGITAAEAPCAKCEGTGRVTVDQPPFPHDG